MLGTGGTINREYFLAIFILRQVLQDMSRRTSICIREKECETFPEASAHRKVIQRISFLQGPSWREFNDNCRPPGYGGKEGSI
jgi:hypothetical protein